MRAFSFSERSKTQLVVLKEDDIQNKLEEKVLPAEKNAVTFVTFVTVDNQTLIK